MKKRNPQQPVTPRQVRRLTPDQLIATAGGAGITGDSKTIVGG